MFILFDDELLNCDQIVIIRKLEEYSQSEKDKIIFYYIQIISDGTFKVDKAEIFCIDEFGGEEEARIARDKRFEEIKNLLT